MHYYQFNIGDYASHTSHLDEMEDLAYRRMLDWVYLHESPLPDDVKMIARLIRMRTHCEPIANVLQEFFILTEKGYIQQKAMEQIQKFSDKSAKAKAAARKRWGSEPEKPYANALSDECERNTNHKPITNNHKPITNKHKKDTSKLNFSVLGSLVGVSILEEIIQHRKRVKAPLDTQRKIDGIVRVIVELRSNGYDVGKCLDEYLQSSWKGFKVEYFEKLKPMVASNKSTRETSISEIAHDRSWAGE